MHQAVLALWPDAPISAACADGRWLRFDRHPHGVLYLQRRDRDEHGRPHYLLVACDRDGGVSHETHATLSDAVAALRRALVAHRVPLRPPTPTRAAGRPAPVAHGAWRR
jgi:hypothetical protein